eukprot:TRINITY_DN3138_c0_g1_i13.p1 TRINITY_DN3138_c0_g1~~TRINITY_DN3138_c0_g1_i13.p1  ORF type:complete len:156 (+),score=79.95 TRINITY_DN3138_c0_g1_i13:455-922(+)
MKKECEHLQEELKEAKNKIQEGEQRERELKLKHEQEVKELQEELEEEREMAAQGIQELSKLSNKREKMLSHSISEINEFMGQLIKEKKEKSSASITQLMLKKLADAKQADDPMFRSEVLDEDAFDEFGSPSGNIGKRPSIKSTSQYQYMNPYGPC